jgi:hypothetical protein
MPITYLDSRSDPRRDEWQTKILRALNNVPLARLVKLSGLSRSTLIEIRAGPQQAASQNQEMLTGILRRLGLRQNW